MLRKHTCQMALSAIGLTVSAATLAAAPLTVGKIADEWGTIYSTGARTGSNGIYYWNAEGSALGTFACTAPVRFYLADAKAKFDAQFGAGLWQVVNVRIVFEHSNSSFTAAGPVDVYLFSNDTLAITNNSNVSAQPGHFSGLGASPLRYDAAANELQTKSTASSDPVEIFGSYTKIDRYNFSVESSDDLDVLGVSSLPMDMTGVQTAAPAYSWTLPSSTGDTASVMDGELATASSNLDIAAINADLQASDKLSLILVPASGTVAPTYNGSPYTASNRFSPRIYITADVGAGVLWADFDGDGMVNDADMDIFQACMTGPAVAYDVANLPVGCPLVADGENRIAADPDGDGDVDLADFGRWQRCFSGEELQLDVHCGD